MENCTIYSHKLDFDQVISILKSKLPKAHIQTKGDGIHKSAQAIIKGGLFSKEKSLTINYRQREKPSYKLDQAECGLTQNLIGMVNFIQNIPSSNQELKNKFLYKVMSANCEMPFMAEPKITPEFKEVLLAITTDLEAFIFTPPNSLSTRSQGQQFLDKNLKLILDTTGASEVNDLVVQIDAKYHDEPADNYKEDQIQRRNKSIEVLKAKHIKFTPSLPCVPSEENLNIRSKEEVSDRIYALMTIAAYGEGVTKEQLKRPMEEKRIKHFSPKEQELLDALELSDPQKVYATWRYESLQTLMWAAGLIPELCFPSELCNVSELVGLLLKNDRDTIENKIALRSNSEILDQLDLSYRMHWACVDARIKNEAVSGNLNPSVLYERHYAFNWLTRHENATWDDVSTNT